MPQFEPQYMLVVDRKNNLDSLQVQVEVRKDFFSDDMGSMLAMKKALSDKLKSVLSISAEVKLMEPNSIARSEGKSKRVIDKMCIRDRYEPARRRCAVQSAFVRRNDLFG